MRDVTVVARHVCPYLIRTSSEETWAALACEVRKAATPHLALEVGRRIQGRPLAPDLSIVRTVHLLAATQLIFGLQPKAFS